MPYVVIEVQETTGVPTGAYVVISPGITFEVTENLFSYVVGHAPVIASTNIFLRGSEASQEEIYAFLRGSESATISLQANIKGHGIVETSLSMNITGGELRRMFLTAAMEVLKRTPDIEDLN